MTGEHSIEPWQINDPSSYVDLEAGTMIYAPNGIYGSDGNKKPNTYGHLLAKLEGCNSYNHLANAERIIACVNACKGISNEDLNKNIFEKSK